MKRYSLLVLLLVVVTSQAIAQGGNGIPGIRGSNATIYDAGNVSVSSSGNSVYNTAYQNNAQRTVTQFINDTIMLVTVSGLYNAKADAYTSTFALSQYGTTVDSATGFISDRLKRFTDQLKKLGIKKDEISIDEISQVPVYEYSVDKKLFSNTYNEIPTGYEIKKNITIGYNNPELMDDIMTAAAKSEIYDIVKVDYNVADIAGKYSELRKSCLKQIKEKIEDFSAMGLSFKPLQQTFTEAANAFYPLERYSQYQAYNNSSVQVINASMKKGSEVNGAIKSTTYYYNKLPYNQFDVVLNSQMIEPSVQFTYSVSVKYVLKGPDRPVAITAPVVKNEVRKAPRTGKQVKMRLPKSVNFKFDVDEVESDD